MMLAAMNEIYWVSIIQQEHEVYCLCECSTTTHQLRQKGQSYSCTVSFDFFPSLQQQNTSNPGVCLTTISQRGIGHQRLCKSLSSFVSYNLEGGKDFGILYSLPLATGKFQRARWSDLTLFKPAACSWSFLKVVRVQNQDPLLWAITRAVCQ